GDAAPCAIPGVCWDDLQFVDHACFEAADCLFGACVVRQACQNAPNILCTGVKTCGKDATGTDLGACAPVEVPGLCAQPAQCDASFYATPAQPIAALPAAASTLIASLDAQTPAGNTPTGPALSGALQQVSSWASTHPDHRVVAVLATDGSPTACSPTNTDEISDLAADALAAEQGVKTVVIGVLTQADLDGGLKVSLDKIARGGGTGEAILVDTAKDITAQFQAALDTIRTDPLTCEFKIPEPAPGKDLDYQRVNVNFKSGKQSSPLYYVAGVDDCDPDSGGWYYDRDPRRGLPSTIFVCPANCGTFQATTTAKVEIALGCETIVK
ncbi:MAG TPA: vWA domain-containing protein, partial [Polyangiaceae bacterium]|nr:vWA domain-containing protein [Polyangiaceae bacterium]